MARVWIALLALLVATIGAQEGKSVDITSALMPTNPRGDPEESIYDTEFNELPSPSPPVPGEPVPVDLSKTTIGNKVSHRTYMDYDAKMQLVFPGIVFAGRGVITSWSVYAGRDCKLHAQVFRRTEVPLSLQGSRNPIRAFDLVGENELNITGLGNHTFEIDSNETIAVQPGDVLGFTTKGIGCISWSNGGERALYTQRSTEMFNRFGHHIFVGDGLDRTYSISATGTFGGQVPPLRSHVSPTSSVSLTPSESASPSAMASPSGLLSLTPSGSPQPSTTASASTSYSPSVSEEAPSPSSYPRANDCSKGPSYWCSSRAIMQKCNVTEAMCEALAEAIFPSLPSTMPSITPSVSPTISITPSMGVNVLNSATPSPTPSTSYVHAPYIVPSSGNATRHSVDSGTGLSSCHYCNGGSDWTKGQCLTGRKQSPISIQFPSIKVDDKLDLHFAVNYNITRAMLGWNDYAFTLSAKDFGLMNIDGVNYDAEMVMLRAPSEHKIEGSRTPLEMQIFHRQRGSNPPKILAVSVLFEETAHRVPELDWIFKIRQSKDPMPVVMDIERFFSDVRPLVFYEGSMTIPPCEEGVTWAVAMGGAKVSHAQMQALDAHLKGNRRFALGRGNNRMLQELNGRSLVLRSNCGLSGALSCGLDGVATADQVPQAKGGRAEAVEDKQRKVEQEVVDDDGGMFDDGEVHLW